MDKKKEDKKMILVEDIFPPKIDYAEYLFLDRMLIFLRQRKQRCESNLNGFELQKEANIREKIVPTQTPKDLEDIKKLKLELEKTQNDIDILDPLFDEVAERTFKAIEEKTGKKFKTMVVVKKEQK